MMTRKEILRRRCEIAGKKGISDFAMGALVYEIADMVGRGIINQQEADEFSELLGFDREKYKDKIDEYLSLEYEEDNEE